MKTILIKKELKKIEGLENLKFTLDEADLTKEPAVNFLQEWMKQVVQKINVYGHCMVKMPDRNILYWEHNSKLYYRETNNENNTN